MRGRRVEPREAVEIRVGGLCLGVALILFVGWSEGDQNPRMVI